jgi:CheY-like chemotaxis protein
VRPHASRKKDGGRVLLRIEVSDQGIGIAPETSSGCSTAFEQADDSMTRKYGGTGLGLAISKRSSQLMGGDDRRDSQAGQAAPSGSPSGWARRRSTTPPAQTCRRASRREEWINRTIAGARVLLAEDEPINQEVSRYSCSKMPACKVDLAGDGRTGRGWQGERGGYALILMDMQMPNLNGVDATRAIRLMPGYVDIPILAMTANAFDVDRRLALMPA